MRKYIVLYLFLLLVSLGSIGYVLGETKYVGLQDDGWLLVRRNSGGIVALPWQLKVDSSGVSDGRERFVVKEGKYIGQAMSVSVPPKGGSYLTTSPVRKGPAQVTFSIKNKKLTVAGLGSYAAFTDPSNPIEKGTYNLWIPDFPHGLGSKYSASAGSIWFLIGDYYDRYLHPGKVSQGCVTVTDTGNWEKIAKFLMVSRKDDRSVGVITVVD
eukprot:GEZU01010430.1.p1 GENE.GEZU01010430.1~~GEZU01010430.1.p1  ORF type:complete len:212 (+),score=13.04 GEZU01010430.1:74-709(+)